MKAITLAEFKRQLPLMLLEVAKGESIIIQKGRKRENVAMLTPFKDLQVEARKLGPLSKRGKPLFKDWSITEQDLYHRPL